MNTLNRATFLGMDHVAQMSHIRSGGRIVDDAPVYDRYAGMPFILDARARLTAIQAIDAQVKRMADDEAAMDRELAEQRAALSRVG
jgi:hypothetical protein